MTEAHAPDLADVLSRYAIDTPRVTEKLSSGIVNDNWLVTDSAGARYILRAYRRVRDPERVLFQLRFQDYLREQGYPTAEVIRTADGEPFLTFAGMPWALFVVVEGQEFDFTRLPQAAEAGRRLAEFHEIMAGYDGPVAPVTAGEAGFSALGAPPSSHTWDNSVLGEEHEDRLGRLFPGPEYAGDLGFFSDWRRRAAATWPNDRSAALPRVWLHCDYHGRNMLFRDDEMAGLFDFDFVTQGPRVFDVARGLFNFGREKRGSRVIREEFCRAFLDGYETRTPLTDEERGSLGFMAVLNWCPHAAFYEGRLPEEGAERIAERLRFDVIMMRALDAEIRRLAPEFGWAVV